MTARGEGTPDLPMTVEAQPLAHVEQSPMAILAQLGRDGANAEALAVIADLVWKQEDREETREFARDFAAFQRECPDIQKTAEVDTTTRGGDRIHFFFADLPAIERVVKPILLRNRITYAWDSMPQDGKRITVCILTHENGKERRGTFVGPMEGGMSTMGPDQKHASSMTYGRRQSLVAVLGIGHADTDTDSMDPDCSEPLNDAQIDTLARIVEEIGQDEAAFLKYATKTEDGKYEDITVGRYNELLRFLEDKRAILKRKGQL